MSSSLTSKTEPDFFFFPPPLSRFFSLAILGDVTGDTEYTNAAVTSAVAGMKSAPWQGSDGIITEGQDNPSQQNDANGFKGIWIRALGELYRRSGNNKDLQTLIHSYVDVQANTLIKNSNDPSNPSLYPVNVSVEKN